MDSHSGQQQQSQPFHASARLQNQMYDAASNFPPPRRQNIACDACRSRKVRCHQLPGQDKCTHCQTKNYPCTHFVQQATSERKRTGSGGASRPSKSRTSSVQSPVESIASASTSSTTPSPRATHSAIGLSLSPPPLNSPSSNPTMALLRWLFSPVTLAPTPSYVGGASFQAERAIILAAGQAASDGFRTAGRGPEPDWGDVGKQLANEAFLAEFALDLIEVYMQICHTRQPILNPVDFRARFNLSLPQHLQPPDTPQNYANAEPLPPALLAVVLAWGSKFSEHPLLIADRDQNNGRSRVSKALVTKAMEVADGEKVARCATVDNILTCMIIEGIQSHAKGDPDRYQKYWVDNAIRLMLDLQINRQPGDQGTLVFCWWIACLADAIGAAYLRRKPMLDDDDYDARDLASATQFSSMSDPVVPAPVQAAYLSWYTSLHALARVIRQMCRWLWIPATETDGIPYDQLAQLVQMFSNWRDEHLDRVGVPSNFEADWDFVAAVTACSSDATFHLMWIILSQAVEEYGIKEYHEVVRSGDTSRDCSEFEALKQTISEEAHHGALRIAGLAGVLTNNGYLRLDPNALHYGIYAAGHLLATTGRPEVASCIDGLKQYGTAYEDALDQAAELEEIYAQTLASGHQVLNSSPVVNSNGMGFDQSLGQAHAMALAFSNNSAQGFNNLNYSTAPSQMTQFSPAYADNIYRS